ncbi:MAG: tetratricopeptide repeat protein [Lewinellaceae bacterium]|nr:tetratricopeptide repeat protein [Lewinellaceae bacterium]
MEQIAAMYIRLEDFKQARNYFDLAIPLIEKYGDEVSLAASLNNLGLFYFHQARYVEAMPYFRRSEALYRKNEKHKEEAQALNNQAAALINLQQYKEAINVYDQCLHLNTEFKQYDNIITNYSGLANLYEDSGDLTKALEYLNKYYNLRDSLIGAKTQKDIAELERKYASQQKEMEIQKSQTALVASKHAFERLSWIFTILIISGLFGVWRWRVQTLQMKHQQKENERNLIEMTRILLDKNSLLASFEELMSESDSQNDPSEFTSDFEDNLLNQRVLTNEDWESFKSYFEKSIRVTCTVCAWLSPASAAQRKGYSFSSTNLTNREAAAILGISVQSVKKTRNRLRHRLELGQETELEVFIRAF